MPQRLASALHRARPLCALRVLPARLSHVPRHRRRSRQPARAHRADARAGARGDRRATDPALREHLDACLGCRGCEPACPSGVGYGRGLEAAREMLARAQRGIPPRDPRGPRRLPASALWRPLLTLARWFRGTGVLRALAGRRPSGIRDAAWAMLGHGLASTHQQAAVATAGRPSPVPSPSTPTVALFRGCVMDMLFRHVHDATRRTLEANGYRVVEVDGQGCCGALHEHAGDRDAARVWLAQERRGVHRPRRFHRGQQRRVRRPAPGLRPPARRRRGARRWPPRCAT